LNKFLGKYDWDKKQLNLDRLEELQKHNETRWSTDGSVVIDDTFTEKTGDEIPNVGRFYDHADGEYIWDQNLVYSYYNDDKTGYLVGFRLYEKDAETKIELATQLIEAAETRQTCRPKPTSSTRGTVLATSSSRSNPPARTGSRR
jgi:hypothetical protein